MEAQIRVEKNFAPSPKERVAAEKMLTAKDITSDSTVIEAYLKQ